MAARDGPRALKDISNRISPEEEVANVYRKGGYNLRPRKNVVTKASGEARTKKKANCANVSGQTAANTVAPSSGSSNFIVPHQCGISVDDIDQGDWGDPQFATAYVQDIYEYLRSKESSTSVRPYYMKDQIEINEHMRMILVNWLIEVHHKFSLVPESLYLTVNVVDRFLTKAQVTKPKLQLVGITALLIASKYEEIWPVALDDCIYITDKMFTRNDILQMESAILTAIDYRVGVPSAHAFLLRFLKAGRADEKIARLSCFILDGTLHSYFLLHFLPSQLAAAAVFIARKTVGTSPWSAALLRHALYSEEEILPVARAVVAVKTYCSAGLHAVNTKYSSSRYGGVSKVELCSDF